MYKYLIIQTDQENTKYDIKYYMFDKNKGSLCRKLKIVNRANGAEQIINIYRHIGTKKVLIEDIRVNGKSKCMIFGKVIGDCIVIEQW